MKTSRFYCIYWSYVARCNRRMQVCYFGEQKLPAFFLRTMRKHPPLDASSSNLQLSIRLRRIVHTLPMKQQSWTVSITSATIHTIKGCYVRVPQHVTSKFVRSSKTSSTQVTHKPCDIVQRPADTRSRMNHSNMISKSITSFKCRRTMRAFEVTPRIVQRSAMSS